MNNRTKLREFSLVMIFMSVLNVFTFVTTVISGLVDGSVNKALNSLDPNMVGTAKITLVIFAVLMLILTFSDVFIGLKGLKISREPKSDKGYITVTKVFFVLNIIAVVSSVLSLVDNTTPIVDGILTLVSTVLDTIIYAFFIKAATAVRQDVINKA